MTVYRRQEDGSVVVATVVRARSVVYPSIDAVEGADISVAESDAEAVLNLLRALQMPQDTVD